MTKKTTTTYPAASSSTPQSELTALLLDVLRGVNREVESAIELGPDALAAVAHYRAIALDLATLPENTIDDTTTGFTSGRA